jgi:hypothetical protein
MPPISLAAALALMYFYIGTFRIMCAVPNMAVFCSFLTSRFPGMVLTYFLNDFEMVPVAPIITIIIIVVACMHGIYSLCYCHVISHVKYVPYLYISSVQCPIWLFSVIP